MSTSVEEPSPKRVKLEHEQMSEPTPERQKGVAPIKKEYLIDVSKAALSAPVDDDEAEAAGKSDPQPAGGRGGKKTERGQNHNRQFGNSRDAIQLCKSRAHANEFDALNCPFGEKCRFEHDIRKYLKDGKREDLTTFDSLCPVFQVKGKCGHGWSCRFAGSHSKDVEHEDGRKELVPLQSEKAIANGSANASHDPEEGGIGVANVVSVGDKITLRKKKFPTPKSDQYLKWLDNRGERREEGAFR